MHIILHQPEIPANTGNIGRTCVATGTSLHLIEPLGFRLNEKEIKRAGMDYWQHLDITRYMNFQEFREMHPGAKIWMGNGSLRFFVASLVLPSLFTATCVRLSLDGATCCALSGFVS